MDNKPGFNIDDGRSVFDVMRGSQNEKIDWAAPAQQSQPQNPFEISNSNRNPFEQRPTGRNPFEVEEPRLPTLSDFMSRTSAPVSTQNPFDMYNNNAVS